MKPSVFSPSYCTVTLGGLSRVRLRTPYPPSSKLSGLPLHPVEYPPQSKSSLSEPAAEAFRACALKYLERLDASAQSKISAGNRADWRRMKAVVEETEVDRLPWVAGMPSSSAAPLSSFRIFRHTSRCNTLPAVVRQACTPCCASTRRAVTPRFDIFQQASLYHRSIAEN